MNVIARLEFELAYHNVLGQYVSHYDTGTSLLNSDNLHSVIWSQVFLSNTNNFQTDTFNLRWDHKWCYHWMQFSHIFMLYWNKNLEHSICRIVLNSWRKRCSPSIQGSNDGIVLHRKHVLFVGFDYIRELILPVGCLVLRRINVY